MEGFTAGCAETVMGQPGDGDVGPRVIDRGLPTSAGETASHAVPAESLYLETKKQKLLLYSRKLSLLM